MAAGYLDKSRGQQMDIYFCSDTQQYEGGRNH